MCARGREKAEESCKKKRESEREGKREDGQFSVHVCVEIVGET